MDNVNTRISWIGPIYDHSGYAYMNRKYVRALYDNNWSIKIAAIPTREEVSEDDLKFFRSIQALPGKIIIGSPKIEKSIRVIAHLPMRNVPKDMKNIIYTMIETENIKKEFIDTCNANYDYCFTPSEYYKNKFIENGFNKPVYTMPIGIDEIYFDRVLSGDFDPHFKVFGKSTYPKDPEGYKFLSVFRWNFRKGPDCLIRSFLKEFKKSDNVSLVLFSKNMDHRRGPQDKKYIHIQIDKLVNKYGKSDSAPIYLCEDSVPIGQMPDMYAVGNCFVLPSLGEGLGLPLLEASAMGLPLITTGITAMTDYCTEDNSYLLHPTKYAIYDQMIEWHKGDIFIKEYSGEKFPIMDGGVIDDLAAKMRHVMNNTKEAKQKNEKMVEGIKQNYKWDKLIEKMEGIFRRI